MRYNANNPLKDVPQKTMEMQEAKENVLYNKLFKRWMHKHKEQIRKYKFIPCMIDNHKGMYIFDLR